MSETISPRLTDVRMPDDNVTSIRLFAPQPAAPSSQPLVIIWPGFGVGGRYYDPMGRELAQRGFPVATGELRGQGSSTAVASRKKTWGYHHLAAHDYPATIRAAKAELGLAKDHPTVLLCHSMGGQIAALFMARPEAKQLNVLGFMGVGTGTPYYGGFRGKQRMRLHMGPWIIKAIISVMGYQPEGVLDVSGYGRQAKGHLSEWVRYSQTNRLTKLLDADMDYEAEKRQVTAPILLTRCLNDEDCPLESAKNLAISLPNAQMTVEEIAEPLGHNRWARQPDVVADRLERFVAQQL